VIGLFLLPLVSLLWTPRLAIVSLDGRLWLIVAWLSALSIALPMIAPRDGWHPELPVVLAIVWSSLFWLAVVSDLGVGHYMLATDRLTYQACQFDPLAVAFTIWETHPTREHLFLGWQTFESFGARAPYANHVHPFLFLMYAWTGIVRVAGGVPLFVATNTVPVLYMGVLIAAVCTLLHRARVLDRVAPSLRLAAVFTACGVLVTTARFWNDLLRYSTDNPYPLLAAVLTFVAAGLIEPMNRVLVSTATIMFVALSPIHTPMILAALTCLFAWRRNASGDRDSARALARPIAFAAVTGAIVYALPWLLIRWKGYIPHATPFLNRSGLDGETRYFTNMLQAVFSPCPTGCCWSRPSADLLFPAFVPLVAFVLLRAKRLRHFAVPLTRIFLFLLAPYLFSVILFPQSISIHPYMYDHMVIVPVTVAGIMVMFEWLGDATDPGTGAFGLMLIGGGAIMSNLIGIAQGLSRMPR
jgi:hypothetical protein